MVIKDKIRQLVKDSAGIDVEVVKPKSDFGDYAVFVRDNVQVISDKLKAQSIPEIKNIEIKGNYINFFLTQEFLQSELSRLATTHYALPTMLWSGKTVIVEYTDPNPFKLFHIGHMMSNAIGESIARLYEASGGKVIRVTWQGDVGIHIAKAIWWMIKTKNEKRKAKNMGEAYAEGNKAYEENPVAKEEIIAINKKIYDRSDPEINQLYDEGRKESLEYFETQYARLGSKFDRYFFESEEGPKGLELVKAHPDVFVEGDPSTGSGQGAPIVFHGQHTRVFVNSQGLPTYEAKELGLNQEKFNIYHPDLSVIVTANEIKEYFQVLMEAMQKIMPEVATKTRHVPHGMMRLPTGKMSSRTGTVITADEFIETVKRITNNEQVAIGAIKYSILKQGIGNDIIFDFDKAVAIHGDSGVYIQYTYARLVSILTKAGMSNDELRMTNATTHYALLTMHFELAIIKHLIEFSEALAVATERLAPSLIAQYVYELANRANRYYEEVRILDDADESRKYARLALVSVTARIIKQCLELLGISAPDKV